MATGNEKSVNLSINGGSGNYKIYMYIVWIENIDDIFIFI